MAVGVAAPRLRAAHIATVLVRRLTNDWRHHVDLRCGAIIETGVLPNAKVHLSHFQLDVVVLCREVRSFVTAVHLVHHVPMVMSVTAIFGLLQRATVDVEA